MLRVVGYELNVIKVLAVALLPLPLVLLQELIEHVRRSIERLASLNIFLVGNP